MSRRPLLVGGSAVALGLAGLQIWLIVESWAHTAANDWYWRPFALSTALVALVYVLVGMIVVGRRPENRVGPLLALIGISVLAYQATGEYALRGLVAAPGSMPGADIAAIASQTIWILPFSMLPVLLLIYPTGRLLSPRWRISVLPPVAAVLLITVGGTLALWPQRSTGAALLFADLPEIGPYAAVALLLVALALLTGIASVITRWRSSAGVERLQMKWIVPAGMILLSQSVLVIATPDGNLMGEILLQVGLASIPVLIGLAILRYRLYDIDRLISRTVSYGTVIAVLAGVYVAGLGLFTRVLPFQNDLAVAAATLAAAALFNPLRRGVSRAVDHRFYRARYDAELVTGEFASHLRDAVDASSLADDWAAVVSQTLRPTSIAVWVKETGS